MFTKIKNKLKTITGLLIFTVFLTSIIPAILNYSFDFYLVYKESVEKAAEQIKVHLTNTESLITNHFEQSKSVLVTLTTTLNWDKLEDVENKLSKIQEIYWDKLFHHIMVLDSNGRVIISPTYQDITHKNQSINLDEIEFNNNVGFTKNVNFFKESNHFHPLVVIKIPKQDLYLAAEIYIQSFVKIFNNPIIKNYVVDQKLNGFGVENNTITLINQLNQHQILSNLQNIKPEEFNCGFFKNHLNIDVYACAIKTTQFNYVVISEMPNQKIFELVKIQLIRTTIVFILLGVIIIYILYKISKRFIRPIHQISSGIDDMEQERGLNLSLEASTGIMETDLLVSKFNSLLNKISNLIQDIRTTSENIQNLFITVKNTSQTLEKASVDLSSILEENSASLQEINTNMEDIEKLGKKNYNSAKEIQELIQINLTNLNNLGKNLENLAEISQNTANFTKESKNQSEQLKNMIYSIQETSERITEILSIIREISDRTNLLSLNASIEAARAGESGKGFAVVAQSISNLAETTEKSVQDIEELIEQTTTQMNQAIQFIDKSSDAMNKSFDMVLSLDQEIQNSRNIVKSQLERSNKIFDHANKMTSIATDNFNSIKFIKNIISEIHKSIDQASQLSLQFAEVSKKLNDAVLNLDNDAKRLKVQIRRFSKNSLQ
ncbi:MAG: methyl-accepting chemotaxis protein [Leptospiraceae bacterium]|nr:methyl-accepting chemotaxis protein [Leptospiraceae bacterium]